MRLVATANPNERHEELGQFLTASPVAGFMASMFGPLPRTVRLLDAGAGALLTAHLAAFPKLSGRFAHQAGQPTEPMKQ